MMNLYEINMDAMNIFEAMQSDAGKKILIITKNTEYKDFIVQEGLKHLKMLFDTSVLSIDEFYLRHSLGSYKFLSEFTMRLIIKKVIDMNKKEMPFLNYASYMDLIFEAIKEAYAKDIDLLSYAGDYKKLYHDYDKILNEHGYLGLDSKIAIDEIKLRNADAIYFVGFNEMNKKLAYLVEKSIELSKDTKVFIEEDFASDELISYLSKLASTYNKVDASGTHFEAISKKLFNERIYDTEGISFVRADSVEAELDYVLTDIKSHVLKGDYEYSDVLIYLMDKSEELALTQMLDEYSIAINKNKVLYLKDLVWQEKLYEEIRGTQLSLTKDALLDIAKNFTSNEMLLDKFDAIFVAIEEIYGKDISKEDYIELLKLAFKYEVYRKKDRLPYGVSIYTADFDTLRRYKLVYVLGMGMDSFPKTMNENFLLDSIYDEINYDKKEYMSRLSKNLMKKIFKSAEDKLSITYSSSTRSGADQGASSFYNEFYIKDRESSVDKWTLVKSLNVLEKKISLATNEEQKMHIASYKGLVDSKFINYDDVNALRNAGELSKYNAKLESYSAMARIDDYLNNKLTVSFLDSFKTCPYAALLGYIYEINAVEEDMKARHLGTYMHKVLESYYRNFIGGKVIYDNKLFTKTTSFIKSFNDYDDVLGFELENIESYIKDFIVFDEERMKNSNYIVKELEKMIAIDIDSYKIKGKIDRVDQDTLTGKLLVIDYKKSKVTLKDNLQLGAYALYYKHSGLDIAAAFIAISKFDESLKIMQTDADACEDEIRSIIAKVKSYAFPIIAKEDNKLCPNYCPYKSICKSGRE